MDHRYTQQIKLPYPKVGTANPTVKLFVKDLTTDAVSQEVIPPQSFLDRFAEDYIYFRAYWITPEKLGVVWMNRVQNSSSTSECSSDGTFWNCTSIDDLNESNGWLLLQQPFYKPGDDSSHLQILPKLDPKDGLYYQHLAKVTTNNQHQFLSDGPMVVTQILTWINEKVYFVGTNASQPGTRHLYLAQTDVVGSSCRTCDLPMASTPEEVCQYSDFFISPDSQLYVQVTRLTFLELPG